MSVKAMDALLTANFEFVIYFTGQSAGRLQDMGQLVDGNRTDVASLSFELMTTSQQAATSQPQPCRGEGRAPAQQDIVA
eukprot:scaffold8260_cov112-Skeletonema_dohrnii-CCMP3373.AAC.3